MNNKVTVIGGSGFVGTNFCEYLNEKHIEFEIIDLRQSCKFPEHTIIGDIRNIESLRNHITGTIVVNLAAVHSDNSSKEDYYLTNVLGAQNLTEVCSEKNINKIIFTSSVAVYGFAKPNTSEAGEITPFNNYGRSKYEAERIFCNWQRVGNHSLTIIRPTVIFGEGNRGNVYNLFKQISGRRFLMIGNGQNKKSLAYVKNIAAFLTYCVENQNPGICTHNYLDTPNLSMKDLVDIVQKCLFAKSQRKIRIPYLIGILGGITLDLVSKITGKKFMISSIRIKKFVAESTYETNIHETTQFHAPFELISGIHNTLDTEFINPNPNLTRYYTE